jgi:predicted O-methyltransferase YrrM
MGLDRDESADVVVLTDPAAEAELAPRASAVYSRIPRTGSLAGLPHVDRAHALHDLPVPTPATPVAPALPQAILEENPPWAGETLPAETVPGMITDEEKRYFRWIGKRYSGAGAVVELGPWLGCSTHHIVAGLEGRPGFDKLHVYDDFVWRSSWMDGYYDLADRPEHHGDFKFIFDRYAAPISDRIVAEKCKFVDYDGNQSLPQLEWTGGPVEIMYIDCGRTIEANEAWWKIFSPHFVPGKTLVIMQDWQLWKEQPPQWYNQTKEFTDSKGAALELLHELRDGAIGTFLYHGEGRAEPEAAGPVFDQLIAERPAFHEFDGQPVSWNNGNPGIVEGFLRPGWKTLETGCGYSSVVFAAAGCEHTVVTPEQGEADRVAAYCRERGHRVPSFRVGASQDVLPGLDAGPLDAVLIDGAHAFPHPILDWFYVDRLLKINGLLFLDDTQLMGVFLLDRYLARDWHWEEVHREGNLAVYRKLGSYDYLPYDHFGAQPVSQEPVTDARSFLAGIWPEALDELAPAAPFVPAPSTQAESAAEQTGPPDFVGVGSQKAGTTWWFDLITQHPHVRYPRMEHWKEARLFVEEWAPGREAELVARYHELFPRGAGELVGEWTPDYLHFSWVPELLAQAAPDAKLLTIVRDPVERYRSALAHHVVYDIPITRGRLAEAYRGGLYARQLKRVLEHFPRERVLVLQYEQCTANPVTELEKTYAYLGLGAFTPPTPARPVHETPIEKPVLPERFAARLVERYRRDAEELDALFPGAVDLSLWRTLA